LRNRSRPGRFGRVYFYPVATPDRFCDHFPFAPWLVVKARKGSGHRCQLVSSYTCPKRRVKRPLCPSGRFGRRVSGQRTGSPFRSRRVSFGTLRVEQAPGLTIRPVGQFAPGPRSSSKGSRGKWSQMWPGELLHQSSLQYIVVTSPACKVRRRPFRTASLSVRAGCAVGPRSWPA
jgi:hypothetical protein